MTLEEFVDKYTNKKVDFDGKWPGECVDLARQYIKDVLKAPQWPPVEGAADMWDTYPKDAYKRFKCVTGASPQPGDIVIWSRDMGKYGHVAIALEGHQHFFVSLDQNFPLGSKVHKQQHQYTHVLGWFRYAIIEDMEEIEKLKEEIRALNTEIGEVTAARDAFKDQLKEEVKEKEENYEKWQSCLDRPNKEKELLEKIYALVKDYEPE